MTKRRWTPRGRRPYHPRRFDHGELISKPNYCLTVVVWVCLAAMILWTVRPQTHALLVDLPTLGYMPPEEGVDPQRIIVSIDIDGTVRWDGETVSLRELSELSYLTLEQPVTPLIVLRPDPMTSYEQSLKTLAVIRQSGVTYFCFGDLYKNAGALATNSTAPLHSLLASVPAPMPPYQSECDGIEEPPPPIVP